MGTNLVIVALPEDDDPVWKVSSEKKPHMTLLFLGEAESVKNLEAIMLFVQHAVEISEHGGFFLDIDRRGTLGEDEADVVYFRKGWGFKWINHFRNQLLQNSDIRMAYDSTEQYPEWLPHLTLGYPETPANDDEIPEYGLNTVRFDRIAVWTGDYEGPDFRLEWAEREEGDLAVAYSDTGRETVEELLHVGVKGMRWGVRKAKPQSIVVKPKNNLTGGQIAGLLAFGPYALIHPGVRDNVSKNQRDFEPYHKDKKWEKQFQKNKKFVDVHNAAADQMNNTFIEKHNKKYQNVDFNDSKNASVYKKYQDEYTKEFEQQYGLAAEKVYGKSPSGKYQVSYDNKTGLLKLTGTEQIKHAADEDEDVKLLFLVDKNDDGRFGKIYPVLPKTLLDGDELAQTAIQGSTFVDGLMHDSEFAHYGVKGMRWGQRKERFQSQLHERRVTAEEATRTKRPAQDVRAYPTIGASKRTKARVDTKGGEDHPPTEDAIKVAVAKQKYKKNGPAVLSNQELQEMERRLNLENNVDRLMRGNKTAGQKFIDGLLGRGGKDDRKSFENQLGNQARSVVGPVAKTVVKKAVLKT